MLILPRFAMIISGKKPCDLVWRGKTNHTSA